MFIKLMGQWVAIRGFPGPLACSKYLSFPVPYSFTISSSMEKALTRHYRPDADWSGRLHHVVALTHAAV